MNPLRSLVLAAAGNDTIRNLVATAPLSRSVLRRFVAGETTADAVSVTERLVAANLDVTLDYLGEDSTDRALARTTVEAYLSLLADLAAGGLTEHAEISLRLSSVGQRLDESLALDNAAEILAAADRVGTTVTLDLADHTSTDSTLGILAGLRKDFPKTGAVLPANLRRTEADCRDLAGAGSRVRLCGGGYAEPESVAFTDPHEVDLSYVRCANALLGGAGYPMFATHDPRLIRVLDERARWYDRKPGSFEFQLRYGIRPDEQRRLASDGAKVRVQVPYGPRGYAYLMRRLVERPTDLGFFLRALATKS
ncbi:MAG TPA: proline dehydrogenase family protein [Pseudonocardiaceae bacterium]|nr:proline dehydrogenase family protein [Pseudonocardiaceae bacterium]